MRPERAHLPSRVGESTMAPRSLDHDANTIHGKWTPREDFLKVSRPDSNASLSGWSDYSRRSNTVGLDCLIRAIGRRPLGLLIQPDARLVQPPADSRQPCARPSPGAETTHCPLWAAIRKPTAARKLAARKLAAHQNQPRSETSGRGLTCQRVKVRRSG